MMSKLSTVKRARLEAGLTQSELCKIVQTSPRKMVQIERGIYDNVTKSLMIKISKALGISVQELFFSDDEEENKQN